MAKILGITVVIHTFENAEDKHKVRSFNSEKVPVEGCAYRDGTFPDQITLPKIDIYFYDDHYFIRPRTDQETE